MKRLYTVAAILLPAVIAMQAALAAEAMTKVHRIAFLDAASQAGRASYQAAFKSGLKDLGYIEGTNYRLEARYADGRFEQLSSLAQAAVASKPDVILVATTPGALAAKAATTTIPIVFVGVSDPIGAGIVKDLARSRGNITGIANVTTELAAKRLQLLKEMLPGAVRIAVLINPDDPNSQLQLKNLQSAGGALKVRIDPVLTVKDADGLVAAF